MSYVSAHQEREFLNKLLQYQAKMLAMLFATLVLVGLVEWVFPDFFNYPYLQMPTLAGILAFWPLLLYAALMAWLSSRGLISTMYDFELFSKGTLTSVLAGLWEELGYRCLFICTAMIAITWSNWVMSTILSLVLAAVMCGGGLWMSLRWAPEERGLRRVAWFVGGSLTTICGVVLTYWFFTGLNPVHLGYEYVIVPTIWLVTFGTFSGVLYDSEVPRLFIFGAVLANAWFRDGHKYQGLLGVVNSWIVGFVMLHAMLHYGLWTAVILHVTYDLFFDIFGFIARKSGR